MKGMDAKIAVDASIDGEIGRLLHRVPLAEFAQPDLATPETPVLVRCGIETWSAIVVDVDGLFASVRLGRLLTVPHTLSAGKTTPETHRRWSEERAHLRQLAVDVPRGSAPTKAFSQILQHTHNCVVRSEIEIEHVSNLNGLTESVLVAFLPDGTNGEVTLDRTLQEDVSAAILLYDHTNLILVGPTRWEREPWHWQEAFLRIPGFEEAWDRGLVSVRAEATNFPNSSGNTRVDALLDRAEQMTNRPWRVAIRGVGDTWGFVRERTDHPLYERQATHGLRLADLPPLVPITPDEALDIRRMLSDPLREWRESVRSFRASVPDREVQAGILAELWSEIAEARTAELAQNMRDQGIVISIGHEAASRAPTLAAAGTSLYLAVAAGALPAASAGGAFVTVVAQTLWSGLRRSKSTPQGRSDAHVIESLRRVEGMFRKPPHQNESERDCETSPWRSFGHG